MSGTTTEPTGARPADDHPTVDSPADPPAVSLQEPAESPGTARRIAALFVLPYLLIMIAWALSNPPGSAPDESDHLVKSIAIARLQIGSPANTDLPAGTDPLTRRNASVSRVVSIPADLSPAGYGCTAFDANRTAACLPGSTPTGSGEIRTNTAVGSYPPFLYLPIGLLARAMDTPVRAFLVGRLVCVAMAALLLFFGTSLLVRWLGRRALLGAFLALTPMAVFSSSMVSTSGVEICGAFAVACVGVVAMRRRHALTSPALLFTLAGAGAALILSRQLGSVTFAAIIVLAVVRVGWRPVLDLFRRHSAAFVASLAVLVAAIVAIVWWERSYDHPTDTGPALDDAAFGAFLPKAYPLVRGGIGLFGWLDTPVPQWIVLTWILLTVSVVGIAILLGSRADRWTLVAWLVLLSVVAYVAYATVFYPIKADLQARHLLPFFQFAPLLAGVVLVDALHPTMPTVVTRIFRLTAVAIPAIQFGALYVNARRYAVGADGPINFAGHSQWSPKFGWGPWLLLGLIGAGLLAWVILRSDSPSAQRARVVEAEPGDERLAATSGAGPARADD